MRSQSTHPRLILEQVTYLQSGKQQPCHFITSRTPATPRVCKNVCNRRRCKLVRNLMGLKCCSVLRPTCPPTTSKNSLGGRVADLMGRWWRGGPFKGHPLLGRARPSRPEDKLKSIVAKLHCHLSPALADQKKASEQGRSEWPELGGNCHNMSTWKCAFGGPPRDQKIKKL